MPLMVVFLILGFVLLLKGADWLIEGACSVAKRAGLPELLVGLTLVSFGTSLPEFFINLLSRFSGDTDMTLGDIFGSNIANILLVLGVSAAIRPVALKKNSLHWEILFALAAALALALLMRPENKLAGAFSGLSRLDGLVLLALFALFLFYIYRLGKENRQMEPPAQPYPIRHSLGLIAAGIPALAFGAKGVVTGGMGIASMLGIPESVIALTIIAVGTSLPELAASVVASLRNRPDIVAGNVIGSNIFNICWVLGVSALVKPLPIPKHYMVDAKIIIGVTLLLLISIFFGRRGNIGRGQGIFFVVAYLFYVLSLIRRTQIHTISSV